MSGLKRSTTRSRNRARSPADTIPRRAASWTVPWPHVLGIVFAVSLVWRLLYLNRLAGSPLAESLTEDATIYWRWSGYLMQHGWWGKNAFFLGPLYPYT